MDELKNRTCTFMLCRECSRATLVCLAVHESSGCYNLQRHLDYIRWSLSYHILVVYISLVPQNPKYIFMAAAKVGGLKSTKPFYSGTSLHCIESYDHIIFTMLMFKCRYFCPQDHPLPPISGSWKDHRSDCAARWEE